METFLAGMKGFHLCLFFGGGGEVWVYFNFEAYFHSPNAADGETKRGFAIEYVAERTKQSSTFLCLQWAESPLKSGLLNKARQKKLLQARIPEPSTVRNMMELQIDPFSDGSAVKVYKPMACVR